MKTCLSILLFCLQVSLSAQNTWHVRSDASGAATGLSWTDAFNDLHFALDLAQPGDAVWVAQGVYRTDTVANRERYFELPSGVRLLGGFVGTETSASQSDPAAHPTILSGNIGNPNDSLDNAYCVLYLYHPDSTTLVDGFTVEHGFADKVGGSNQEPGRSGAGVFVYGINGAAWPEFRHCLIRHNFAKTHGGGLYINGNTGQGNTPLFKQCTFFNNQTELGNGAALYWTGGSNFDRGAELEDCVFNNNISGFHGGALFISKIRGEAETVNIRRCTFTGNKAISWGGVCMYNAADSSFRHRLVFDSCVADNNLGRAGSSVVHFFNTLPTRIHLEVLHCTIQNFQPTDFNGLLYEHEELFFAEILSGDRDSFIFRNNTFANNVTTSSFFFFLGTQAHLVLENNRFLNNQGPNGGACRMIESGGKSLYIANNLFYANRFRLFSSAQRVDFLGNIVAGNRYARQIPLAGENLPMLWFNTPHNDSIHLNNNLFVNNICQPEVTATPLNPGKLMIYNNIFYNNKHAVTGQNTIPIWRDTTFAITNIIDFDNCSAIPNLLCFPSNLSMPNLMLRDTAAGDYRLLPCSIGINAGEDVVGSLLTDYLGNPRISGPAIDIGPYEDPLTGLSAEYLIGPSCANTSTGSLTFVTDNTGCPPYEVSWNNEGPFAGITASPLPAGPVAVTLTDADGRTMVVNVTVPLTPSPELLSVVSHASSATTADGAVVVEPPAGSGPYQYLWSTADTTNIIGGLLPGIYTLTLTDAEGCPYMYAYEVSFNISTTEYTTELPSVSPNPASNTAQVRWNGCDVLEVYSMQGQKLLSLSGADGNQFTVSQLQIGLYQVVFLKNGRMLHLSRLVVAH